MSRALLAALLGAAQCACGLTASLLFPSQREWRESLPVQEPDAQLLCDGLPCPALPVFVRRQTPHPLPWFAGTGLELGGGAALAAAPGVDSRARAAGYALIGVGVLELIASGLAFPNPPSQGWQPVAPATIVWHGQEIAVLPDDLGAPQVRLRGLSAATLAAERARVCTPAAPPAP